MALQPPGEIRTDESCPAEQDYRRLIAINQPLAVMHSHSAPKNVKPLPGGPRSCFRPHGSTGPSKALTRCCTASWRKPLRKWRPANRFRSPPGVRRALCPMVYSGNASIASLSRLFGLQERTRRRQLDAEGTTVHELVNEARFEVAQQLLRDTRLPVSEIAALLHYSSAPAFSHALRSLATTTPKEWRARHGAVRTSPA